jgi:hypothetical protein
MRQSTLIYGIYVTVALQMKCTSHSFAAIYCGRVMCDESISCTLAPQERETPVTRDDPRADTNDNVTGKIRMDTRWAVHARPSSLSSNGSPRTKET